MPRAAPILEKCCTQRLLRKLRADYGYDGEGYAVWLFRTGAQDGPDDVSEIREVAALGDGRYGWTSSTWARKGAES